MLVLCLKCLQKNRPSKHCSLLLSLKCSSDKLFPYVFYSLLTLQIFCMPVWGSGVVCWISKDKYPLVFPICRGLWLGFDTLWSILGWQLLAHDILFFGNKKSIKYLINFLRTGKVRDVPTLCFNYFPSCSLSVWLQRTLPWGTLSSLRLMNPTESDDGPIMWVRPGEQMIPVADIPKSPFKRKRWVQQHSHDRNSSGFDL